MGWMSVNGYRVLQQSHEQSCGYCCVGMVVRLVQDYELQEMGLVGTGKQIDPHAYDRAAWNRVGAQETFIVQAEVDQGRMPHWGSGTYGHHLAACLQSYRVRATFHGDTTTGEMKAAMRRVTPARPMIVLVQWFGGGGHWVTCVNRNRRGWGRASNYTFLDPGGQVVTNRGSTTYRNGGAGVFGGYFITIEGAMATQRVRVM